MSEQLKTYLLGMAENVATLAAVCVLFWLSGSWWSLVLLLNLNTFRSRKS